MSGSRREFLVGLGASGLTLLLPAHARKLELEALWKNPPRSCRPHTRWWWPGSAVSRDGIVAQLRGMKDNGLGGVEIICSWEWYEKGNIPYLSPQWFEMVRHTIDTAAELDMEVAITYSPGWDIGGFWVPPEHRSKVLAPVWIDVDGPLELDAVLPAFDRSKTPRTGLYEYIVEPEGDAPDAHRIVACVAARHQANRFVEDSLVDITSRCEGDRVRWSVPAGRWRVAGFRLEYTGQQNSSQNYSPRNWIVDHYSKAAMRQYCDYLTGAFRRELGSRLGRVVDSFFSDSFEVMPLQDTILWSNDVLAGFRAAKGYDLTRYLPALWWDIGEVTPRIRYDANHYLSDLVLDTVYDTFRTSAASVGVENRTQPHYRFSSELIQGAGACARPETEVTTARFETIADPRKATVAGARFYGRKVVSAEAYTFIHRAERYRATLEELKRATDAHLRDGVTQFYNHGYVYSEEREVAPSRDVPFAERISRWNTWWPHYKHLAAYVSRCCSLARAGEIVADVLLYSPQAQVWSTKAVFNSEQRIMQYGTLPKVLVANGYDYDPVNDHVLQTKARFENGRVRVGAHSWRFLILPDIEALPLETLRAIERAAEAGVVVVALGRRPGRSVGLQAWPERDAEVQRISSALFNGKAHHLPAFKLGPFSNNPQDRPYEKTPPPDDSRRELLTLLRRYEAPDFEIGEAQQSDGLAFHHRRAGDVDYYFVTNLQPETAETTVRFRVAGRSPERWDPMTGATGERVPSEVSDGRTAVPLRLEPWASAFYVFRSTGQSPAPRRLEQSVVTAIDGPWTLRLEGVRWPASHHKLERLASWSEDPSTRHFSGTGTYTTEFNLRRKDGRILLDLGGVAYVAEVVLNGVKIGVGWMQPYRFDITRAIRSGRNRLEVRVTNLLFNYVAGLKELPVVPADLRPRLGGQRADYTRAAEYWRREREYPPPSGGLLGPVRILVHN